MDAVPTAAAEVPDGPTARQNSVFFLLTLGVFLVTRLWGLDRFPIFFFCDEAVQTVQGARLAANGMRDSEGTLLPTYLRNTEFYNLSIGAYLEVLPARLLPRSVFVARALPILVIFSAMAAAGLILRDFLKLRFWWVGVLALSGFPGFFLHTRIAFELMLAASFYVWFLYFYLRYRSGRPRAAYAAAVFAALTFYGYNTFQPVVVLTAILLALLDARWHWQNRLTAARALLLLLVLALPYARFVRAHSRDVGERLRALNSYWTDPALTAPRRLARYGREYLRAYSPRYWFVPDAPADIDRHRMKDYAHVPLAALPFIAAGILLCLARARSPGPRTLLVAFAAAPAGAAIVQNGITRSMILVFVFGMLLGVAADPLLRFASRFARPVVVGAAAWLALTAAQGAMLADALRNGPTWYRNYGLYGMQWGAREVFGEVRRLQALHPGAQILMSPSWANGMDDLASFFLPGPERDRVVMANVDWLRYARRNIPEQTLAVMTEAEYLAALAEPGLVLKLDATLAAPDALPGFRFAWVRYADDFDTRLAAEREGWHRLVEEDVRIDGVAARVSHSVFDAGEARHLFDGDPATLVRTEKANPAEVDVTFDPPRRLRRLVLTTGSMQFELRVEVEGPGGRASASQTYKDLPLDPTVTLALPDPGGPAARVKISVRDINNGDPQPVHLREVRLE